MTIFIIGEQKRVPRPQLIEGLDVDEFIARNADPIWLHDNEMWEYIVCDDDDRGLCTSESHKPRDDPLRRRDDNT